MDQIEAGDKVRHKTNFRLNGGLNFEVLEIENERAKCSLFDEDGKPIEEWFEISALVFISKAEGGFLD